MNRHLAENGSGLLQIALAGGLVARGLSLGSLDVDHADALTVVVALPAAGELAEPMISSFGPKPTSRPFCITATRSTAASALGR